MPAKNGRNVSLTAQQDKFIDKMLSSGRYGSASEVVREALRLLEQEDRRRLLEKFLLEDLTGDEQARLAAELLRKARIDIRAKIQEGLGSLDRGDVVDGAEIFNRWRKRIAAPGSSTRRKTRVKRRR
jgi:antitoxin ParD1/3/4